MSTIRCHRCNTTKTDADKGIFLEWEFDTHSGKGRIIVWFHNHECKDSWIKQYQLKNTIEHEYSEKCGMINPNNVTPRRREFNE